LYLFRRGNLSGEISFIEPEGKHFVNTPFNITLHAGTK
jgi:hypothetical protein